MANIIEKLKSCNVKDFQFEEVEENVALVSGLDDAYVFVEYFEEDDEFLVHDGGYVVTECVENFGESKEVLKKLEEVLIKYEINKEEEPIFLVCKAEALTENINKLIQAEREILG